MSKSLHTKLLDMAERLDGERLDMLFDEEVDLQVDVYQELQLMQLLSQLAAVVYGFRLLAKDVGDGAYGR